MNFLALIPLRLWLIAGGLALLGGLLWHDHHLSRLLKAEHVEKQQALATLEGERANRATEQKDRSRADAITTKLQTEIDSIRRAPTDYSVLCRATRLPRPAFEGHSPALADGAAIGRSVEEPALDIAAALDAVRVEHQTNAARARALIEWEKARTH